MVESPGSIQIGEQFWVENNFKPLNPNKSKGHCVLNYHLPYMKTTGFQIQLFTLKILQKRSPIFSTLKETPRHFFWCGPELILLKEALSQKEELTYHDVLKEPDLQELDATF